MGYYVDSAQPFWEPRDGGLDVYFPLHMKQTVKQISNRGQILHSAF